MLEVCAHLFAFLSLSSLPQPLADLQEVCVSYGTFSALIGSNEKANGRVVKMWAIKTLETLCDRVQTCQTSDDMVLTAVRLSELEQVFESMRIGARRRLWHRLKAANT